VIRYLSPDQPKLHRPTLRSWPPCGRPAATTGVTAFRSGIPGRNIAVATVSVYLPPWKGGGHTRTNPATEVWVGAVEASKSDTVSDDIIEDIAKQVAANSGDCWEEQLLRVRRRTDQEGMNEVKLVSLDF